MAADCADVEEPSSKMLGSNQTVTIGTSCTGRLEVTGDSNWLPIHQQPVTRVLDYTIV